MLKREKDELEKATQTASVLAEALPWINSWEGKTVVVKYGGSAMEDPELRRQVVADVVLMRRVGIRIVLVHGGGKAISALMKTLDLPVEFVDGLRVTTPEAMDAVQMALVGKVNQMLVSAVDQYGDLGVGISGADGRTFVTSALDDVHGRVGKVERVNTRLVESMLNDGYIPVVAGVGWGEDGSYNINADVAASELAIALHADKLIYLSDVDGLYRDFDDESSLVSSMGAAEVHELVDSGTLERGMIPKVTAAAEALDAGVTHVHFLNGTFPHSLLLEVFTDAGIGTMFYKED